MKDFAIIVKWHSVHSLICMYNIKDKCHRWSNNTIYTNTALSLYILWQQVLKCKRDQSSHSNHSTNHYSRPNQIITLNSILNIFILQGPSVHRPPPIFMVIHSAFPHQFPQICFWWAGCIYSPTGGSALDHLFKVGREICYLCEAVATPLFMGGLHQQVARHDQFDVIQALCFRGFNNTRTSVIQALLVWCKPHYPNRIIWICLI